MVKYCVLIFFTIIIILMPMARTTIITNHDIKENTFLKDYTKLAVYMAKRFISPRTNTLVIIEKCAVICKKYPDYHTKLLEHFLKHLNETLITQLFVGKHGDRLWDYNLFIVDSYNAFQALRFTFPFTQQERLFYFYILLTWNIYNRSQLEVVLHQIFLLSYSFNVRNVVIMSKSTINETIHFYTYQIYTPFHCQEKISIQEFNRFENGLLQHQYLFPDHISNFYGCSLNVSARNVPPVLSFDGDMNNQSHLLEMHRLGGIEGEVLKVLANVLNFKFQIHFTGELSKIIQHNESTGCFRDLERHQAELVIGGLSTLLPNSIKHTSSIAYHSTPFVFVVRSGLCFGPITQLLNSLRMNTWILFLGSYICSIIIIKIVEHYSKPEMRDFVFGSMNKFPIRYLSGVLLGNPVPTQILPKRNLTRFLLMSWLLLSFEVRNGYQGKMFDSLRSSRRIPLPLSIQNLVDMNYIMFATMFTDIYPTNQTRLMPNGTNFLELIQKQELRYTVAVPLEYIAYYNCKNWENSSLTYVNEFIYLYPIVMFFRKHSIMRASIDRKLQRLYDAGIIAHYAKKDVYIKFLNINTSPQYESKLVNRNLNGLYIIHAAICFISIIVFILEILTRKFKRIKRIMDWLN